MTRDSPRSPRSSSRQGFLFAVPALRGGSELGEQWHRAGKGGNRQNSFDDFVAAASG